MKKEAEKSEPKKVLLYQFVTEQIKLAPDSLTWSERVDIYDDHTSDYSFFRITPLCSDGYKDKMNGELAKRGWESGEMGLTFKENISLEELIKGIAYKRGYKQTYESQVINPLADIPSTVSEFLGAVQSEANNELERIERDHEKELADEHIRGVISTILKEGPGRIAYVGPIPEGFK